MCAPHLCTFIDNRKSRSPIVILLQGLNGEDWVVVCSSRNLLRAILRLEELRRYYYHTKKALSPEAGRQARPTHRPLAKERKRRPSSLGEKRSGAAAGSRSFRRHAHSFLGKKLAPVHVQIPQYLEGGRAQNLFKMSRERRERAPRWKRGPCT